MYCLSFVIDPANDNKERSPARDNAARTGDRRIDIDGLEQTKPPKNVTSGGIFEQENDYYSDYYTEGDYNEYEGLLKDYYEGDYYEDSLTKDDSSIKEESEEELPEITRTPRTPSRNGKNEQPQTREVPAGESSRPLIGRRILSANPSQLHIEDPHEMDHMMMLMLRNAIGWF